MYKKLRSSSSLLALLLVLSILAGCAGKKEIPAVDKSPGGNTNIIENSSGLPISKDKITIKVLASRGPIEAPYEQMDVVRELENRTNIHIEWQTPPDAQKLDVYKLVMASGDLPDMITIMPQSDILKYGKDGTIINLSGYIDQMPNLKGWLQKFPDIKKTITSLDGNIYTFAGKITDYLDWNAPLCVRTDWLEKLNLQSPVTPEDWYNVWKAFKEKDPNGNGKPDEIPFSCASVSYVRCFVNGWGICDNFYTDPKDGGKIHYGPIEEKYREALIWINKCYKEGLIDRDFLTNDEKAFQGKTAENLVGSFIGSVRGNLATFNLTLGPKIPGLHYAGTQPLKTPTGEQRHWSLPIHIQTTNNTVITKSNKHTAQTIKLIDYCYGDEGTRLLNFGIEGKHYKMVNGEPMYTDFVMKNPDGLSPINAAATFSIIQGNQFPMVYAIKAVKQIEDPEVAKVRDVTVGPFGETTAKYVLPPLQFDINDEAVRRQISNDLNTYVNEMVLKFIVGTEPLSNWDSYVKKVKSLGLDQVIPIYQKAIDFYNKM